MSEVKIYTVVSDELSPPVIGESFCTDMVRHSDYSALEQKLTDMAVQLANAESKCRELAAENAWLKAVCEDRRTFIMNGVQLGYIQVPTVETDPALETIRMAVSPQEPTPATDACLAEVRAQGLNAFIQHHSAELDAHIKNGGEQFDEKSVRIRDIIVSARLFREQIRKEAAQ